MKFGRKKSMAPGGGGRFEKLKGSLAKQPGVTDPGALAATIGRKKYGAGQMSAMAAKSRKSTKGSASFTGEELASGYRRVVNEAPEQKSPLYPQENKEKKGYAGLAKNVIEDEKKRKKAALDEVAKDL